MLKKLPENKIERMVTELKNADVPVLIWGGSATGRGVKRYLESNGVRVNGFLINREYLADDEKEICGCPVYALEDYLSKNKCDILMTFSRYQESQLKEYQENIHKLYLLDFTGRFPLLEGDAYISPEFYKENEEDIKWLESRLGDEKSRKSLEAYILQKMDGSYAKEEYELEMYFPDDIIHLQEKEVFVDCGAYHGETSIDFISHLESRGGSYKKLICIEADKENFAETINVLKQYENVETICAGVWDKTGILKMNASLGTSSQISDSGTESIEVKAIDDILAGEEATFIKMDIEGAELKALYGAANTIKKYKPKLAICIYHKAEDFIEIPKYIDSLTDDYNFYIRNHSSHGTETVLYAIPK